MPKVIHKIKVELIFLYATIIKAMISFIVPIFTSFTNTYIKKLNLDNKCCSSLDPCHYARFDNLALVSSCDRLASMYKCCEGECDVDFDCGSCSILPVECGVRTSNFSITAAAIEFAKGLSFDGGGFSAINYVSPYGIDAQPGDVAPDEILRLAKVVFPDASFDMLASLGILAQTRPRNYVLNGTEWIDKVLTTEAKEGRFPGFVTVVQKEGRTIYKHVGGYSDIDEGIPYKEDSLFRIYSMTKPITGVALMVLYDQGLIRMSDPVSKFIPAFASTRVMNPDFTLSDTNRPITLLDLATHTSGITYDWKASENVVEQRVQALYKETGNYLQGLNFEDYYDGDPLRINSFEDTCEFADKLAAAPLVHHPGQNWTYGFGMEVLGCVVERVTGQPFFDFVNDTILHPLGMKSTFSKVPRTMMHRMTTLYTKSPNSSLIAFDSYRDSVFYDSKWLPGGQGLVSSLDDYLQFANMLASRGEWRGTRIISEGAFEVLSTGYVRLAGEPGIQPETTKMAVTMSVADAVAEWGAYKPPVGSLSWGGAAKTLFLADPVNKITVVQMTQVLTPTQSNEAVPNLRAFLENVVYATMMNT